MQGQAHQNKLLLFQVGPVKCSLFSNDILTIIPPPRQETAGHNGRLPGMFRHNNRIVRVVDMRSKFGLSASSPERGRLILAEIPKGLVAFWVDQIINVIDQNEGRWDILPAALPHDVFTRTFVLDEELILHTEPSRMEAMRPSAGLTQHIESLQKQERERRSPPAQASAKPPSQQAPGTTPPAKEATPPRPTTSPLATETRPTGTTPTREPSRPQPDRVTPPTTPPRPSVPQRNDSKPVSERPKPTAVTGERPSSRATGKTPPATSIPSRDSKPSPITAPKPTTPAPTPTPRPTSSAPPRPRFQVPSPPPRPIPPASEPTPPPSQEGEGNGLLWLFLLLLLILVGGGLALMYVNGLYNTDDKTTTPPPMAQTTEPSVTSEGSASEPAPGEESPVASEDSTTTPLASAAEAPVSAPAPTAPSPDETGTAAPRVTPEQAEAGPSPSETAPGPDNETGRAADNSAEQTASPYRADIQKDRQGITITLNGPKQSEPGESLLKESEQDQQTPAANETEASTTASEEAQTEAQTESPQAETPTAETQAPVEAKPGHKAEHTEAPAKRPQKPHKHMITHVVVKGDTLWAIAKRYVKDPFRYPELARLSGIKDPDRIYPGDIVRIIEK